MRQLWFKVYNPEQCEARFFWIDVYHSNDAYVYDQLKNDVKSVFNLKDDFDFYFTHTDNDNDQVAIKESCEILNYMYCTKNKRLNLTITPTNKKSLQEKRPLNNTESDDTSSVVSLAESFQSIMKQFEAGIFNLQATVEKNAATVATSTVDTVVKAAAETAAQVYRSMLPPATLSDKPQFDVICDGCYTPIRGSRYRCETCDDFDLCSTCKARVTHNQAHNFRFINNEQSFPPQYTQQQKMDVPEANSSSTSCQSFNPSQTIFICDFCDSDIVGIRHTCGACPDFDLCHSCFSIVKENHPDHIFVTHLVGTQAAFKGCSKKSKSNKCKKSSKAAHISSPRQSSSDKKQASTVYHRGVECDNCDANITGIRYKCGHCANYDLCEICEQYAPSIHDSTHSFIKIRYPIQSIIQKPMLPKFTPLKDGNLAKCTATITRSTPSAAPNTTREMEKVHAATSSTNEIISKPEEIITAASSSSSTFPLVVNIPKRSPPAVIKTTNNTTAQEPVLSASFVSDINIPDGTLIVPKKTFIKMWKIVNDGNIDWPVGTHLLFNGGSILRPYPISRPDSFVVPVISPNEQVVITAELQAPDCPGGYSSYFCLCTSDGVRFGDSLWCSIKVDQNVEPEEEEEKTPSLSAADIMMNSSNSMIYPTVLTASSSSMHQDGGQQQGQLQTHDEGYTDHDDYSEFTHGHVSPLISEITRGSFTNSHLSSPSSSDLDIGEDSSNRQSYFPTTEEEEDTEEKDNSESFINRAYQVISPSASQYIPTTTASNQQAAETKEEQEEIEEEDFVIVDEQEQDHAAEELNDSSNNSNDDELTTAASSIHSIRTVTSRTTTVNEDYVYRSQLLQLHEMGFTSYDDLAMSLLNSHQGRVDEVLAKLLEYP